MILVLSVGVSLTAVRKGSGQRRSVPRIASQHRLTARTEALISLENWAIQRRSGTPHRVIGTTIRGCLAMSVSPTSAGPAHRTPINSERAASSLAMAASMLLIRCSTSVVPTGRLSVASRKNKLLVSRFAVFLRERKTANLRFEYFSARLARGFL